MTDEEYVQKMGDLLGWSEEKSAAMLAELKRDKTAPKGTFARIPADVDPRQRENGVNTSYRIDMLINTSYGDTLRENDD